MSVIFDQALLDALLETETGPVGLFVRDEAEKIADAMKDDVRSYYAPANTTAEDDVIVTMNGSTAIVELQDDPQGRSTHTESKSARYARVGRFEKTRQAANP